MAARLRTLPAASRRCSSAPRWPARSRAPSTRLTLRLHAARRDDDPGRDEPLQRLLRRPPRRRRRGPARPGARDGGRPRAAAPGARRDLRLLRRSPCSRASTSWPWPGPILLARRRRLDPRRRALHRRPAALRLRGARRGLRLPVLRHRRRRRAPTSCRSRATGCRGRPSPSRCRSGCSPRRSSWSTTCATSSPTAGRGRTRSPSASGASARARCTWRCSRRAFLTAPRDVVARALHRRGCCCPWLSLPAGRAPARTVVRTRTDGPALNGALAGTGALQLAVLRAARRRACCCPDGAARRAGAPGVRRRRCGPPGARSREREILEVARRATRTASRAGARRRRSSPTTACRSRACAAALEAYAPLVADWDGARGAGPHRRLPRAGRPAPGPRRARPRAVGPRGPARGPARRRAPRRRAPRARCR